MFFSKWCIKRSICIRVDWRIIFLHSLAVGRETGCVGCQSASYCGVYVDLVSETLEMPESNFGIISDTGESTRNLILRSTDACISASQCLNTEKHESIFL